MHDATVLEKGHTAQVTVTHAKDEKAPMSVYSSNLAIVDVKPVDKETRKFAIEGKMTGYAKITVEVAGDKIDFGVMVTEASNVPMEIHFDHE